MDELKEELVKDLPLSDTEEWIKKLESISSIVESTRKAIKEYDGKIAKIKTRTTELEKNITDIETVKILELPKKEVSEKEFTQDVNNGMNKADLVKKYELSPASIKSIAKELGLTIKRTVKPKFKLVKDLVNVTSEALNTSN